MTELLTKWRRATSNSRRLGRPPTQEEVAAFLGLSKKKLAVIKQAIRIASAGAQTDVGDEGLSIGNAARLAFEDSRRRTGRQMTTSCASPATVGRNGPA